jgi:hypothetical protein
MPLQLSASGQLRAARETATDVCGAVRRLGVETYTVGRLLWRGGARTRGQYLLIERNSKDLATLVPFTVVAVCSNGS